MTVSIEKLVATLGTKLTAHGKTLSTAESCTGGGLSYWLTSLPGSSAWFTHGYVTYSNTAKVGMLDLDPHLIATQGAVSEAVARQMAESALKKSATDFSLAITGIAGPTGGTKDKPVGTVWIALANKNAPTLAEQHQFTGNRQQIRAQTIERALQLLLSTT